MATPKDWDELAGWWAVEVQADPAYREQVLPLLEELLGPRPGALYLDIGCGEGQGMRHLAASGARVVGCDASPSLLADARQSGAVVRCLLPDLGWIRPGWFDGAYAVLVLEHLNELEALFLAVAGAVRPGGELVVVMNHPAFTAPGSGPVVDPQDGEVLWRWGPYLDVGASSVPAGDGTVLFHHRPLAHVLNAAARAGWALDRLIESGPTDAAVERDPLLTAQRHIPRVLGARWLIESPPTIRPE